MKPILALGLLVLPVAVWADDITLPSGARASLQEQMTEPGEGGEPDSLRLRFIAPDIADTQVFGFARIEGDFAYLCKTVGLPFNAQDSVDIGRIILSIASQEVAFGETAPNIVQYFDAFRVEGDTCIWEGL